MNTIEVKTPKNKFEIEVYFGFIPIKEVEIKKDIFLELCKKGCRNYGKKYSCPPCSPDFKNISKDYEKLFAVLFLCKLNQINSTEYNKIRIANIVMKSKIEKLMRELEKINNGKFLATGSCRLCKPCKLKIKQPCKYPEKRRYSLEAVGIDCDALVQKLFGKSFLWYKNKKSPEYTCVLCGLFSNICDEEKITNKLYELIK